MPYYGYYGGYGDFFANNIYCILLIPVLLLSLWAQAQVSGNFKRYSGVANRRRLTGAQAAEAVLRAHGVYDVAIRPCSGNLTDHYDPRDNSISLSENVYNSTSIAAVGVAAHEAGHAVAAYFLSTQEPVHQITIVPRGNALGLTISLPDQDTLHTTRNEMRDRIVVLLGGRVAEQLEFDDISTGASNDIEQATRIARAMIAQYGMTDEFDMVAMQTTRNQYLGGDSSLSCSPETQTQIDTLTVDLVKTQHQKAIQLLQDNLPKLHEIAKYLYEHETITGEEFMAILMRKPELAAADSAASGN